MNVDLLDRYILLPEEYELTDGDGIQVALEHVKKLYPFNTTRYHDFIMSINKVLLSYPLAELRKLGLSHYRERDVLAIFQNNLPSVKYPTHEQIVCLVEVANHILRRLATGIIDAGLYLNKSKAGGHWYRIKTYTSYSLVLVKLQWMP